MNSKLEFYPSQKIMSYLINETISGVALFNVSEDKNTIELKSKYEYIDAEEAIESIKKLKTHIYTDKILDFLKAEIKNEKSLLYVTDKEIIANLKSNGINAAYLPTIYHQYKSYIHKKDISSLTPEESLSRTKYISNELSSSSIQNDSDTLLIQSVKLFDYLEKEINMHCMRIKEFYGMHFPELSEIVSDNEKYLRIMILIGNKDTLIEDEISDEKEEDASETKKRQKLDDQNDENKKIRDYFNSILPELKKSASTSVGSYLSPDDLNKINSDAEIVLKEMEHRIQLSDYINSLLEDLSPNALSLIGQNVLCKMIVKAGGVKELSKMAASTLQILGAEKALFSSLRSTENKTTIRTPKYGILFHTSLVSNTVPVYKGRMARMVANKLAICLRTDYFRHTQVEKKTESNYGTIFYESLDKKRIRMNEENCSTKNKKTITVEKKKKKKAN